MGQYSALLSPLQHGQGRQLTISGTSKRPVGSLTGLLASICTPLSLKSAWQECLRAGHRAGVNRVTEAAKRTNSRRFWPATT